MYLYKLEVELQEQKVYMAVLAENEAQAFDFLEEHLVRHFVSNPEVVEASIIEKKRAVTGAGYIMETHMK
ncbi:DUF3906 family protein [Paenibacillus sp. 32352]|uniref:DUF3906 family protein n=1 Tax=Paenibacillus sp. 32352 TaxID=1969111 RepID=UPI0009ABD416|nr:DUF3906 family protein [Paenibacillus sp. 32352]